MKAIWNYAHKTGSWCFFKISDEHPSPKFICGLSSLEVELLLTDNLWQNHYIMDTVVLWTVHFIPASLRRKQSRKKQTKFGPHEGVFRIRATWKMGWEQKKWKEAGGGGDRRKRLPANPWILKNPFANERGSWLVGRVSISLEWFQQLLVRDLHNVKRKVCELVQALIYKTWRGWHVFEFTQDAI